MSKETDQMREKTNQSRKNGAEMSKETHQMREKTDQMSENGSVSYTHLTLPTIRLV